MFLNKKATSVVEAIVVLSIIVSWVIWMYKVFWNSQKLANSTSNKIQAIQMAREWIEAIKNIRDTNWLLFGSDSKNCWNVSNYNNNCVWIPETNNTNIDIQEWSYKIYQLQNNRWYLSPKLTDKTKFIDKNYREEMEVFQDSKWFFTQTWTLSSSGNSKIKPLFTREIKVQYLDENWNSWNSNSYKMKVTSLVQWVDNSTSRTQKVEFISILTNWKK
jgi:Tfp pilus assembly protein FimT